jgi:1,4-alpha-glucan branching enzyme
MIHKQFISSQGSRLCRITFTLPEDFWADEIYLVGDFNDWDRSSHPMRQTASGQWYAVLDLETGRTFEFRYLCDGEWINDDQADAYSLNPHGTHNSVVMTALPAGSSGSHRE